MMSLAIGVIGSVAFTNWAGRANPSLVLMIVMSIWVASPFVLLALAWRLTRESMTLVVLSFLVTIVSLPLYGIDRLRPQGKPMAAMYVMTPPVLWAIIVVVVGINLLRIRAQEKRASA
jgi:hypothetical protein